MLTSRTWLGVLVVCAATAAAASCSSGSDKRAVPQGDAGDNAGGEAGAVANAGGAGNGGKSEPSDAGGVLGEGGAQGGDAGGTAVNVTDEYRSGARLRAILEVSGTAQRFVGWHDSALDIDCEFKVDTEGTQRCLPIDSFGGTAYSDSKCQNRVALIQNALGKQKYAQDSHYEFVCGHGREYLTVGKVVTTTQVFTDDSGSCLPASFTVPDDQTVYALGAVVPDSTFVAESAIENEPRGVRLTANVRVASDGSREVIHFDDAVRKVECIPREHQGADYGCVPEARAYLQVFFLDANCMTPAAYHPGYAQQVCGRKAVVVQRSQPNFTDLYYEVGAEKGPSAFSNDGSGCKPTNLPASLDYTFYEVGKPVPWSAFPQLPATIEGTGRMQRNTLRDTDGILISRQEWYDTTLKTLCQTFTATDSIARCAPARAATTLAFSDAKCTQALYYVNAGDPAPSAGTYLLAPQANGSEAVFEIGAKLTNVTAAYQLNGAVCETSTIGANFEVFGTTLIPAADLAAITRTVE